MTAPSVAVPLSMMPTAANLRMKRGKRARLLGWSGLTMASWLLPVLAVASVAGNLYSYRRGYAPASGLLGAVVLATVLVATWAAVMSRTATAWLQCDEVGLSWRGWGRRHQLRWSDLAELRLTRLRGRLPRSLGPVGIRAATRTGAQFDLGPSVLVRNSDRAEWVKAVVSCRGDSLRVVVDAAVAQAVLDLDAAVDGLPAGFDAGSSAPATPLRDQDWVPVRRKTVRTLVLGTPIAVALSAVPLGLAGASMRSEFEIRDKGVRVQAEVVRVIDRRENRSPSATTVEVRFRTITGADVVTRAKTTRVEIGPTLDVRYLPDEPSKVRVVNSPAQPWVPPLLIGLTVLGVWTIVAASCVMFLGKIRRLAPARSSRRSARPADAPR